MIQEGRSSGLLSGTYRTPSLELVSRFINVERFLIENQLLDMATGTLAQKCAKLEALWQEDRPIEIVADSKTSRSILDSFRNNLKDALQRPFRVEINQVGPSDLPVIGEGSVIILFTDIIFTGSLVGRLFSQVIRAKPKHIPTAVVSILDARREPAKAIKILGYPIKTVSLAQIDIIAPEAHSLARVINISPVNYLPEADEGSSSSYYPISTNCLADMIERQEAMYFRHVVRPNGRHFCFYLDALQLLGITDTPDPADLSPTGEQIIAEFAKVIDEWNDPQYKIDLICFPLTERPSAAEIIAKKLAEKYETRTSSVSRAGEASSWRFPSRIEHRAVEEPESNLFEKPKPVHPKTVVVVDWGSMTGKSVRELIRLAASAEAEQVLVVIFLSQLTVDEEQYLTQINAVTSGGDGENAKVCRVSVKFLARFPIRSYDALHCPHCRQLHRLNEEERFHRSDLLREFVEDARQRLRPCSSLSDAREERTRSHTETQGADAYVTNSVDPERNIIEIAQFRDQLERAQQWTSERQKFYCDLIEMEEAIKQEDSQAKLRRGCLIRLLAAEWTWLKQEPLNLSTIKGQIANLAVDLVKDPDAL